MNQKLKFFKLSKQNDYDELMTRNIFSKKYSECSLYISLQRIYAHMFVCSMYNQ